MPAGGWREMPANTQLAVIPPGAVLFNPAFWWHEIGGDLPINQICDLTIDQNDAS